MHKKYKIISEYEVEDESEYNNMFNTEQEAIDSCKDKLKRQGRQKLYIAMITKEVSTPLAEIETIVKDVQ